MGEGLRLIEKWDGVIRDPMSRFFCDVFLHGL